MGYAPPMVTERTAAGDPAPGPRSGHRRALILATAGPLLHRRGYDRVTMGELAEAAGVGPSALYRHFPGKSALLAEVLQQLMSDVLARLVDIDFDDRHQTGVRLAGVAADNRMFGALWEREARHLSEEDLARLRAEVRGLGRTISRSISQRRPQLSLAEVEFLAWAVVGAHNSLSFHHLTLPGDELARLMGDLAFSIVDTPIEIGEADSPAADQNPAGLEPASRREALLLRAVPMFARHGYSSVSIEDVGAAVGIAGPSVYNHFDTKEELLVTAMRRGMGLLYAELHSVLARTSDPAEAMRGLLESYLRFAFGQHDLLELLVSEVRSLGEIRRSLLTAQRDYVTEWVHLRQQTHPDEGPVAARIRVHAVITVINDMVRMPRQRQHANAADALRAVSLAMLE